MNKGERFRGFDHTESPDGYLGVHFWDLRKSKDSRKRRVESGLYFTVGPVNQQILQREGLVYSLSPYFLDILSQENMIGERVESIADPRQSWRFSEMGLTEENLLLVHAEPIVPDDAQGSITLGVDMKPAIPYDQSFWKKRAD